MNLSCLIVDDEPLARERIRTFLATEPDLEIAAELADGAAAVESIQQLQPDLVFLDVQMPRLNGFEVLEALAPDTLPEVIFTTAYDAHALRAFEVSAVDYLLKPIKHERFKQALDRARQHCRAAKEPALPSQLSNLLAQVRSATDGPRILVKSTDRILFVRAAEVEYIEAAGNYLVLHTAKERHIIRETMATMEKRLGDAGFFRISRSAIVNLDYLSEVQPLAAGRFVVLLKHGARLEMTCPLKKLQERLGGR